MIPNTNCDPVMNSITVSMITTPNAFGHEFYRSYGDLSIQTWFQTQTATDPVMNSITVSMITTPNAFGHEFYRSYGDLSLAVSYIIITIAYILLPSPTDFASQTLQKINRPLAHFLHTFIIEVTQSTTDWMNLHNIRGEWLWFAATAGTNSIDTFAANIAMVAETLHEKYATS